jgi:hypothetical protein
MLERRKLGKWMNGNVIKNQVRNGLRDAQILSPRAGALCHLWQNAPLQQPGSNLARHTILATRRLAFSRTAHAA